MRLQRSNSLLLSMLCCCALVTGCANTAGRLQASDLNSAIEQAGALAEGGQTAQAIELLDAAAGLDPSASRPWLKKAQIQFQAADYAAAIQSAEQAKSRDPSDKDARSIAIVAALRIAIGGLAELRGQEGLGDNAYAEAQRMAAVLKASLGTDTLVPADEAAASGLVSTPAAAAPEPKRKAATRTAAKPLRKPAAAPAAEPPAGEASNPFKDLN